MKIVLRRFLISAQIGAMLALAPTPSFAEEANIFAKAFDVAILRPLGGIRLVVGMTALIPTGVLYSLMLPFNSDTSRFSEAAEILVVDPANYVFRRPLGEEFEGG
jgi:hypothetical protein